MPTLKAHLQEEFDKISAQKKSSAARKRKLENAKEERAKRQKSEEVPNLHVTESDDD